MRSGPRIALSVLLVAAGALVALFFGLLFLVADCSTACGQRGERAPIYFLVGAGLGLAVAGARLGAGLRAAAGAGLLVAGLACAAASAWALARGEGGWVWGSLLGGLLALGFGAWALRRLRPGPPSIL